MVAEDTLEDATRNAYKYLPSTSVAKFNDLYGGAHIQLGMHVIGYKRNERRRKAGVIEEHMKYRMHGTVLLINYENIFANHLIPQFTRLPRQASVAIAQYLMNHPAALQSHTGFRNNSEHFAVSCTLGYDLSFEQAKQIMIAFWALKMIDEGAMDDLANYMISRRVVNYIEGSSNVKLSLQSGEEANISF
ncbi:unnamed protein product [Mytilus edulis]|uniref:Uncharacterized protein n=1 Tax=Mytilus edulis TaxID=6550 RepID=A0A8S3UHE6_MYTED|nr:unnamed protein product [Mytilus edulis]